MDHQDQVVKKRRTDQQVDCIQNPKPLEPTSTPPHLSNHPPPNNSHPSSACACVRPSVCGVCVGVCGVGGVVGYGFFVLLVLVCVLRSAVSRASGFVIGSEETDGKAGGGGGGGGGGGYHFQFGRTIVDHSTT